MQLAGDDGALIQQQQTMVLLALAFQRQRRADQVGEGLDQLVLPVLRAVAVDEVGAQFAEVVALVADRVDLQVGLVLTFAAGAIVP